MNSVKTTLQTYQIVPKLLPVGLLLLGLILGFIWAYGLSPNVYTSAEPVNLGTTWKQEYMKQIAWQFAASGDQDNAKKQIGSLGNGADVLATMLANQTLAADPNMGPKLQALGPFAANNPAQNAKINGGLFNSNITPLLCVVLLALLIGGPVVLNAIVPIPTLVNLVFPKRSRDPSTVVQGLDAQRRKAVVDAQTAAAAAPQTLLPPSGVQGDPTARSMSTYLLNDDTYDDSFSIETAAGKFLGEMGGGIGKTLGSGKPKQVSAFEVWVFDAQSTLTTTKVLVSDYAFNDPGLREELSAKGDLVLAKAGTAFLVESQSLIVQVRVVDVSYGTGNSAPNSFFDRLTFEMSAWPKVGNPVSGSPAPAAMPPMPQQAPPQQQAYPAAPPATSSQATFGGTPTFGGNPTFGASPNVPNVPPSGLPPLPPSDPYGQDTTRFST